MPSGARSRRLPEPWEFFVDRSLGAHEVVSVVRSSCLERERVHVHDDLFVQDAEDTEWLAAVGARRWIILTKDANIRWNDIERNALISARAAVFALGRQDIPGPTMGAVFGSALPQIRTALRRFDVPLFGQVTIDGAVSIYIAGGADLRPPKHLRPRGSRRGTPR